MSSRSTTLNLTKPVTFCTTSNVIAPMYPSSDWITVVVGRDEKNELSCTEQSTSSPVPNSFRKQELTFSWKEMDAFSWKPLSWLTRVLTPGVTLVAKISVCGPELTTTETSWRVKEGASSTGTTVSEKYAAADELLLACPSCASTRKTAEPTLLLAEASLSFPLLSRTGGSRRRPGSPEIWSTSSLTGWQEGRGKMSQAAS
mmetsp:Transcript_21260/g.47968  ORF Transcript_21260/g.47968 Transcript_21260/m.47968 type:complete len:201 (-) Transcript_21260:1830-2432(-)